MVTVNNAKEPVFTQISGEVEDNGITEIESLCMNCHEHGVTRLLLTRIPFFRDVIISSFSCDHCHHSDNEIQSASAIQEKAVKFTLEVDPAKDLNRQIVKTVYSVVTIPELDFEIPSNSQKGCLTTIEGIIQRALSGLEQHQPVRRISEPAVAEKIDQFIVKLKNLLTRKETFTLIIDDASGNSFVENPSAPEADPALKIETYERSHAQDEAVGVIAAEETPTESLEIPEDLSSEVHIFRGNCCDCNAPILTKMKTVDIPHFKEVIIMATVCDSCGYKSNEVKSAGGFEEKGKRMTLNITDPSDLSRDLLKSDTCSIEIPQLEIDIGRYCVGGKFTTIEGLLHDIKDLVTKSNAFFSGDSATGKVKEKIDKFTSLLDELMSGNKNFTLILDDPVGNSYLQNTYAPESDPELKIEFYERTFDQNEELGLNDMKV